MARSSFGKRAREQSKKEKAAAKRERRQRTADPADESPDRDETPVDNSVSTDALLEMIAEVHRQYDAGEVNYEEFEQSKAELLGRLNVD